MIGTSTAKPIQDNAFGRSIKISINHFGWIKPDNRHCRDLGFAGFSLRIPELNIR
jgi:hypothetical protein